MVNYIFAHFCKISRFTRFFAPAHPADFYLCPACPAAFYPCPARLVHPRIWRSVLSSYGRHFILIPGDSKCSPVILFVYIHLLMCGCCPFEMDPHSLSCLQLPHMLFLSSHTAPLAKHPLHLLHHLFLFPPSSLQQLLLCIRTFLLHRFVQIVQRRGQEPGGLCEKHRPDESASNNCLIVTMSREPTIGGMPAAIKAGI